MLTNNGGVSTSTANSACKDPDDQTSSSSSRRNSRTNSITSSSQLPSTAPSSTTSQPHSWSGLKVNQTAFIHKLYSMLEDNSISHLICWTPSNDSFVITPGEEFSKVLAQYFKHTNVSSFVRQLNMYGFHKVNDTFHGANGSSSTAPSEIIQWEFRHGGGAFKRGDVESLRAIKRRASRQSTTSARDGVNVKSISLSVPSTPPPNGQPQSAPTGPVGPSQQQQQQQQHHQQQNSTANPSLGQGMEISSLPLHHHNTPGASPGASIPSNNPSSQSISALHSPGSGGPSHHHYPEWEYRIGSLEQAVWYLQDSNHRLHARNNGLCDALRKTNHNLSSTIDSISKLSNTIKSSHPIESSRQTTTSPRSKVDEDSLLELDRIRQGLHTTSILLNQLDDPAYGIQQTQQPHSLTHAHTQQQPPPPPPQPPQLPPHQSRQSQPPFHNIYNNFKESSRERAQSVIYDPLAPGPTQAQQTQQTQQTPTPTLAQQTPTPGSSVQPTSSSHSENPTPPEPNAQFFSHPQTQRLPPHVYQQGTGAATAATGTAYFNYDTANPTFLPPSREQRPGSFPLVTSSSPYQRMNSFPGSASNPITPNGPISPNPNSSQYSSTTSTPQISNAAIKQPIRSATGPNPAGPIITTTTNTTTTSSGGGPPHAFRRHTSGEVFTSSTDYQTNSLTYMRQGSSSSIGSGTNKNSVGSISSISSVASSPGAYLKQGVSSPPLKHRGSSGGSTTLSPPNLRQNSSSVQSLLNPTSSDDQTTDDNNRQVKRQRAEVL